MPSFSTLLKRSKGIPEPNNGAIRNSNQDATAGDGTSGKLQRRQSKRDFFRNLLSPTGSRSESRTSRRFSNQQDLKPTSPNKPTNSMPNSNKPLPAPPALTSDQPAQLTDDSIILNRIISPLSIADVHKLFSGAPQFFVRSEGRHTGPPKPSVAFPWNTEVQIRDLCDHSQNEDQAWGYVTAYPHITRDMETERHVPVEQKRKQRAYFIPTCHERPNMLSMQGLERGTVGFSAALELGVADALYEGTESPTSVGRGTLSERRHHFLKDKKHGVRPLSEHDVITRLIEIGDSYHELLPSHQKSPVERYTELFTQVLFPPTRVKDSNDPYSLQVQIEALLDVLGVTNIWVDFGIVEWRIRLGQILWEAPYEPDIRKDSPTNVEIHDSGVPETPKFWLLLQILLSCELLTRLDLVTKLAEHDPTIITGAAVHQFTEDATQSVRWSLILARTWLENIKVQRLQPLVETKEAKLVSAGWLATLTGAAATSSRTAGGEKPASTEYQGRHQARQISGLVHFARKLHWPQVDVVAAKFSHSAALIAESGADTPVAGTPLSVTTQRSSYFGNSARPAIKRTSSKQNYRRSFIVQPSGWLSRSYVTGLILPGEGLGHFLISTLLENDESAVSRLGEEANLYGGFTYASKSYWSTACIVGRVLAAGKGSSECLSWLSSEVLPKDTDDGWVNIEVEMPPQTEGESGPDTARIWKKHIIEREGHVLGDGDASTVLPGDFTLPVDTVVDAEILEVTLKSLELFATADSFDNTPRDKKPTPISEFSNTEIPAIKTCSAIMKFVVKSLGGGIQNLAFNISYDVHFVTAHPCVPSHHTSLLDSPTSPLFQVPKTPSQIRDTNLGPHELFDGHPLHKSFIYKREALSQILNLLPQSSTSLPPPLASLHTTSQEVFVVDCNEPSPPSQPSVGSQNSSNGSLARKRNWGSDLEMLARAWCAEKGYNALISRRGRNCIACSVREARALGWKIVLRFG